MDVDILAQRILQDLKNTFKKDPLIDEFGILPVHESVRNSCPVIHVQHKIALEDWCVKHVYVYSYSKFFSWKKKPTKIDSDTLLLWTMAILLINPEIETVWNSRKELMCQNVLPFEDELKFVDLVLSRKPKSSQAFAHRKWILLQLWKNKPSICTLQQVIEHEFFLCTRVANSYPNNYYAWCHRSWMIQELLGYCFKVITEELKRMKDWVSSHISDYSGFSYRQFLISSFHHTSSAKYPFVCPLHARRDSTEITETCSSNENTQFLGHVLKNELNLLHELQLIYPGHEALWNHRRFILYKFHCLNASDDCPVQLNKSSSYADISLQSKRLKPECNCCCRADWNINKEKEFLKTRWRAAKNQNWEKVLLDRHIKWLQNVLLWPVKHCHLVDC